MTNLEHTIKEETAALGIEWGCFNAFYYGWLRKDKELPPKEFLLPKQYRKIVDYLKANLVLDKSGRFNEGPYMLFDIRLSLEEDPNTIPQLKQDPFHNSGGGIAPCREPAGLGNGGIAPCRDYSRPSNSIEAGFDPKVGDDDFDLIEAELDPKDS